MLVADGRSGCFIGVILPVRSRSEADLEVAGVRRKRSIPQNDYWSAVEFLHNVRSMDS